MDCPDSNVFDFNLLQKKLRLYGKLFDSPIGMIGFGIVLFWAYVGFFAGAFDMISTHDPLSQVSGMKNKFQERHSGVLKREIMLFIF